MSQKKKSKDDYPYKGTDVSTDVSRKQIDELLKKYGVEGAQWTEKWNENRINVRFPIELEMEGVHKKVLVSLSPPLFLAKHRSYDPRAGYVTIKAPDFKAAMRALFFYTKTLLEAQFYGLAKIEDVFMSHIVTALDEKGRDITLGDKMRQSLVKGEFPALTYKEE